jgi:hypothetical protein
MTRRDAVLPLIATAAIQAQPTSASSLLDKALAGSAAGVEYILKNQVTDTKSPWYGRLPSANGLHQPNSMPGTFDTLGAALLHPRSKFYRSAEAMQALKHSAEGLRRSQSPAGFLDNLDTNFNSPADTAFGVRSAANGFLLAHRNKANELLAIMQPFVKSASDGLAVGGIHTPNHRWVLCAALAQVNEILPQESYVRRIRQWLAEGIDIDPDGQYSERSALGYNAIVDSALIAVAEKMKMPELYEPVRKNLNALLYLLGPGDEIETGFSRRQDLYQKGTPVGHWFSLQFMARLDGNAVFEGLAAKYAPQAFGLTTAMLYPEWLTPKPTAPLPTDYVHEMTHNKLTRIRRGDSCASIIYNGSSRFFSLRHGDIAVQTVRFASAFFGKATFKPQEFAKTDGGILMTQKLEGPYYQPFTPTRKIDADSWDTTQKLRPQTEVCQFEQSAWAKEVPGGFDLRIRSRGTDWVPMAVEISLREGGKLEGDLLGLDGESDAYFLKSGRATYTVGGKKLHISPGAAPHTSVRFRYVEAKLPGPTLYITGYSPFDHTIQFRFA